MPVKIRLARRGRKDTPMYSVVATDARAPRDGKFIKKLGTYNPNTNPAQVQLQERLILEWIDKGAQLTETVRSLCSSTGILLLRHLSEGVKKGAITPLVAKKRFMDWHKLYPKKKNKKVSVVVSPEVAESMFKSIVLVQAPKAKPAPKKEKSGTRKKTKPKPTANKEKV